jgi:AcrR family transcriptional regulator
MMQPEDNTVNINRTQPSAEPKKYHHGDLADELVTTGMQLLEAQNTGTLGLREVARAIGVSPTAVYRHFPDKTALLRAIAARGFIMMAQMQSQAAAQATGPAAFAAVGAAYVSFALAHPAVFRLMFAQAPPRDLFTIPITELPGPMQLLRGHVTSLAGPEASDATRKLIAIRAWALVHGLAVLALDGMIPADNALIEAVISGSLERDALTLPVTGAK